jgi:(5-formylfuran-3-yl)methyl phosphate synthase
MGPGPDPASEPSENLRVAKLLVSVRSAIEAEAALAGGASIIDIKEPSRGPLGRADGSVWREVRRAVPPSIPVSVALGELAEWLGPSRSEIPDDLWAGIAFRKLGLSDAGTGWIDRWKDLRERRTALAGDRPRESWRRPYWVAVVYLDWERARAPDPDAIIRVAGEIEDCAGVLFDTWDKSVRTGVDSRWERWFARVRESGRFIALAGSLNAGAIRQLRELEPDVFAVRGAACYGGDRRAAIDPERVARLVEAASEADPPGCGTPFLAQSL